MLTQNDYDEVFNEMDKLILELASEPEAMGPVYFQDLISVCRNYQNRASLHSTKLNRERLSVSKSLRAEEDAYALEYDDLMANDEKVRNLSSVEDRKATTGYLLRDRKRKIAELKDRLQEVDAVLKVVTHRSKELSATMTAIRDQKRLMQVELSTGSFYGDERAPKSKPADMFSGVDEDALSRLFDDEENPSEPEADELEEPEADEPEEESTEDMVAHFLQDDSDSDSSESEVENLPEAPVMASEEKSMDPEEKAIQDFLGDPEPLSETNPQRVVGGSKKDMEVDLDALQDILADL